MLKVSSVTMDKVEVDTGKKIKISVCVPTYNMGKFIGRTIESVLAQTFKEFEIIISDNNSSDNTEQIVKN